MQESALIALAVAAVLVAALVWAYYKGKLNSFLPVSWQHTPSATATLSTSTTAAKGGFVSGGGGCGAYPTAYSSA